MIIHKYRFLSTEDTGEAVDSKTSFNVNDYFPAPFWLSDSKVSDVKYNKIRPASNKVDGDIHSFYTPADNKGVALRIALEVSNCDKNTFKIGNHTFKVYNNKLAVESVPRFFGDFDACEAYMNKLCKNIKEI